MFVIAVVALRVIQTLFAQSSSVAHKISAGLLLHLIQLVGHRFELGSPFGIRALAVFEVALFLRAGEVRLPDLLAGFFALSVLVSLDSSKMSASVRPDLLNLEVLHQIHVGLSTASGLRPGIQGLLHFVVRLERHSLESFGVEPDLRDALLVASEIGVRGGAHGEFVVESVVLLDVDVDSVDFAVEYLLMVLVLLDDAAFTRAPRAGHVEEAFEFATGVSCAVSRLLLPFEPVVTLGKSTRMGLNTGLQEQWPIIKRPIKSVSFP